ncbi:MAG: hypothetical protein V4674_02890 [Patescibacteria group bacterium]
MITVSQAVLDILEKSPFLADVLAEGVGNSAKIARKIQKQVEERLYEEVSLASVSMAIHRLSPRFKKSSYGSRFLKQLGDITVRSHLVEFIFSSTPRTPELHKKVLEAARSDRDFLNISHGHHASVVVVSKERASDIAKILKKEPGFRTMSDLASITMRLPVASLDVPGVYYPILKALAWEGINFVEIISVDTELTILFEEKDVEPAFSVLKRLTS